MTPTPLKKLVMLQQSRADELQAMDDRLRERQRGTFNFNIVQSRINALRKIWNSARATHEEIITRHDAAENTYVTQNAFVELQERYEDTLDFLLTLQSELEPRVPNEPTVRTLNSSSFADFELRATKLPKLDLPTFSGKYEDWENFSDLFTTLVDNAPKFADATKLQYLKSCLKGSAAELVKDVTTTNANYATTWQALKTRYHNPRLIVYNHLRALMDLPYLKRESAIELRSFTDDSQRIVRALTNLKMPVEHWDVWFVFVLSARLDPESRKAWETELSAKDSNRLSLRAAGLEEENPLASFPRFSELATFLENRSRTLGMLALDGKVNKTPGPLVKPQKDGRRVLHASTPRTASETRGNCPVCSGPHKINKCFKLKLKNAADRFKEIKQANLCYNCFGPHRVSECSSSFRCKECNQKNHSLIHACFEKSKFDKAKRESEHTDTGLQTTQSVNVNMASTARTRRTVIFATAQLTVLGPHGAQTRVRALLDQGSEASFISTKIASLLNLPMQRTNIPLNGIGNSTAGTVRFTTKVAIRSLVDPSFSIETTVLVLPKLASQLPFRSCVELDLSLFSDIPLADQSFFVSDSVDMLLGADVYGRLLRTGLRRLADSTLTAQNTTLGWIISGTVNDEPSRRAEAPPLRALHCSPDFKLSEQLQRFWELEEVPQARKSLAPVDKKCETVFASTHSRNERGRFVVQLPLNGDLPSVAGETRCMALRSLTTSHRRFLRDAKLADAYQDFMATYERLGHMERVPVSEILNPRAWYLPHHAVVQSTPAKWKLRVVFDASRKTSDGQCLNDFLLSGPALQRDLALILLNWRRYRFSFTADLVKMFRQVLVVPEHRDLQRIVWAPTQSEQAIDYRLTTVTYGTACAPYLAIRSLLQLAEDERTRFPLGAECLEKNTYVDDIFAGADDLPSALRIREELIDLLKTGGITLDKWAANDPGLLPAASPNNIINVDKNLNRSDSIKTLGVH